MEMVMFGIWNVFYHFHTPILPFSHTLLMDNAFVKQKLQQQFGESVVSFEEPYGMLTFESPKDLNLKMFSFCMMILNCGFSF